LKGNRRKFSIFNFQFKIFKIETSLSMWLTVARQNSLNFLINLSKLFNLKLLLLRTYKQSFKKLVKNSVSLAEDEGKRNIF